MLVRFWLYSVYFCCADILAQKIACAISLLLIFCLRPYRSSNAVTDDLARLTSLSIANKTSMPSHTTMEEHRTIRDAVLLYVSHNTTDSSSVVLQYSYDSTMNITVPNRDAIFSASKKSQQSIHGRYRSTHSYSDVPVLLPKVRHQGVSLVHLSYDPDRVGGLLPSVGATTGVSENAPVELVVQVLYSGGRR